MKYLLWLFIPILLLGQVKTVTQTGVKRSMIRGDATTLTWTVSGDYSSDSLLFIAMDNDSNAVLRLTTSGGLTASYSSPNTTITGTIHAATTENFIAQNYLYDISSVTDSVTLIMGLLSVIADVSNLEDTVLASVPYYTVALDTPAANNNFIVGMDSTNRWYQKTLAQTRTILGIDTITGAANLPDSVVYDSQISDMVTKSTSQTITGQKNFSVIKVGADTADVYKRISQTVNIEEYIGAYDTSQGWSLVIQAAIDANLGTGKNILFDGNKTYDLQMQGNNPYQSGGYCVDVKTGGFGIIIPLTTTLRMKDNQQTDATGEVVVICGRNTKNLYMGGGGKILGNTAGQTGWTRGYNQLTFGEVINIIDSPASGFTGLKNITIENLEIGDHFANPINLRGGSNVRVSNIKSWGFGEGIQLIRIKDFICENLLIDDSTGVDIGDGFELSDCKDGYVNNITIKNGSGGAAFDLFYSDNIRVDNFFIRDWSGGATSATGAYNLWYSNGRIINCGNAILGGTNNHHFENIDIDSCFIAVQVNGAQTMYLDNVNISHSDYGLWITGSPKVYYSGGKIQNNGLGIIFSNSSNGSGEAPSLYAKNLTIKNNTTAMRISAASDAAYLPSGILSSSILDSNTTRFDFGTNGTNLITDNTNYISPLSTASGGGKLITQGSDEINLISGNYITTITGGLKNQLLRINFSAATEVRSIGSPFSASSQIYLRNFRSEAFQDGDALFLRYDATNDKWIEVYRNVFGNNTGSDVVQIDGFYYDNVNDSVSSYTTLSRFSGSLGSRFYLSKNAKIKSWGVVSSGARTAGTLTVGLFWNGGGANKTLTLDGTNTTTNKTWFYRSTGVDLSEGDYIEIKYITSNDFAPTTADIQVWVELEY